MLNGLLQSTTIPLLEKAAESGERRHEVLVGNIANVETPGYRTRDLSVEEFEAALNQAVELRNRQLSPSETALTADEHEAEFETIFGSHLENAFEASPKNITFQDGGNRSIEHEMAEMTKNLSRQRMAVNVMNTQMEMLRMAISERPF